MVAHGTVNGISGANGDHAQHHVVAELKLPQGQSGNKQKIMVKVVWGIQSETNPVAQTVVQWNASGDSGHHGEHALGPVVEELKLPRGQSGKKQKMAEEIVWVILSESSLAIPMIALLPQPPPQQLL